MLDKNALRLYLCTDRIYASVRPIEEIVEEAILGGVTMVQIREKNVSSREFYDVACAIRNVTKAYHIPLVINDRLDIALLTGADGLHIGQSDVPLSEVRKIVGNKCFIGVSAGNVEEAIIAQENGADYLGAGPVFPTNSKTDAQSAIGLAGLERICNAVHIPVIGIGGINAQNAGEVMKTGASGVAVIQAILAQKDIKSASLALSSQVRE